MRLVKYLKVYGNYTQKELTQLNKENKILVNNMYKSFSYIVEDNDIITVDNKEIKRIPFSYYFYYKPKGVRSDITSEACSYINFIPLKEKMMVCGRLDKESEGLMILTNDGAFINEVQSPSTHYEKEYLVTLRNKITDEFMNHITSSFILREKKTHPAKAKKIDDYTLKIILNEGMYHEIRKIVILSKNRVENLKRIRIGSYEIGNLKENELKEFHI